MFKHKSNKASKAAAKQQPVFKQDYFNNCHRTYSCIHCRAHLANHDELISKLFQGNHGRAYLFNKVVNIGCKQAVQRELLTGLHAVADIYCDNCGTTLGWKYEQAFVASQKYKEGKYIIELVHMLKENDWDLTSYNARELLLEAQLPETKQSLAYYSFQFIGDKYIGRNSSNIRQYTRASSGRIADKSRMIEMTPVISRSPMSQQATNTATTTTTTTTTKTATTTLEVVEGGNTEKDQDSETNRSVREKQSPLYENSKGESSENSKTIATTTTSFIEATSLGRLEIKIISDDIEQLGSSISDHETSKTGENPGNNISSLSTSPKDSICSSRSQSSEASSYISATDSGSSSTDD